jgi:uncharacterized C2H2 Zn-finger protein
MSVRVPLKCPVCDKILFEGFWVATALSVIIHCRCKRVVEIRQDYSTHILQEQIQNPHGSSRKDTA